MLGATRRPLRAAAGSTLDTMSSTAVDGQAAEPGRRERWRAAGEDALDRIVGSDPGLNRLRAAGQAVISIAVILAVEYAFIKTTGALQTAVPAGTPAATATAIRAGNHALLVIAMLLGALVGMLTSIGVNDTTARRATVSTLIVPFPVVASMTLGLLLGGHRALALTSFPVILTLGTLARRWGPRGVLIGIPLFIGDFIGFFLYGVVHLGDLGWIATEVVIGAVMSVVVRLVFFAPDPGAALHRSQLSWAARSAHVADLAARVFDEGDGPDRERLRTRLRRNLVRLNEAALIIDAQLGEPGALPEGSSAQRLHERLFDAELGLSNAARFADALGPLPLGSDERAEIVETLAALHAGDLPAAAVGAAGIFSRLGITAEEDLTPTQGSIDGSRRQQRVLLHRFASSVALLADALDEWMAVGAEARAEDETVFTPAVALAGGWLPGSALVSARASGTPGSRWHERVALAPYVRTAIQVGVAVGAATALGDFVSGRRFYWAVIAAFVSFIGVNNSLEQVRKAVLRVLGTVIGIVIGSLVAHLDGHNDAAAIVVVLIAMFFSVYLIRISYGFMVIGVTIMVSQLYEQLGELSSSLLLLRLGETALGAAIAVVTVLVVLPLRTQRVLVVALVAFLRSTRELVAESTCELGAGVPGGSLALRGRAVDSDYQTLVATARPLRRFGTAGRQSIRMVAVATGVRHYARNLARDTPAVEGAGPGERAILGPATDQLLGSLDTLIAVWEDGTTGRFVRSASRWSDLEQLALDRLRRKVAGRPDRTMPDVDLIMAARDLQLLDGALADLALLAGLAVVDLDTAAGSKTGTGVGSGTALPAGPGRTAGSSSAAAPAGPGGGTAAGGAAGR
jgi:uncharacterized membrane protein YgaE (UPF0421/DUF939 family)